MGSRVNAAGTEEGKKRERKDETDLLEHRHSAFTFTFNSVERQKTAEINGYE